MTKGDASFQEDPLVRYEEVVGRALTSLNKPIRLPYLGSITMLASRLKSP